MSVNWSQLRHDLIGERQATVPPPNIKLPMLPTAVLEFSRKAEDPTAGAAELGRIIETDSGLTAELLRCVNSAATGLRIRPPRHNRRLPSWACDRSSCICWPPACSAR